MTSLRFFAALMVVLYHTLRTALPGLSHDSAGGRIVDIGFISVSFFFLLSGYILARVYLQPGIGFSLKTFYAARFARIYPLFLLTLAADTPNLLFERITKYGLYSAILKTTATFVANALMLQAWVLNLRGIDNPNWSLSVETFFYLLFPFLGVALWKAKKRTVWALIPLIWIAGQGFILLLTPHVDLDIVKFNPVVHLSTFCVGILLARAESTKSSGRETGPRSYLGVAVALLLASAGFAACIHWLPRIPFGNLYSGLLAPVFILVIWAFSANWSLPARLLSVRWLVILGEASFGLYLIHLPVYHLFEHLKLQTSAGLYPLYLALCIGLSVLSFFYVETPARKFILRRMHSRPRETKELASDAQ